MKMSGNEVNEVESFKYLKLVLHIDRGFEKDIKHMIKCG